LVDGEAPRPSRPPPALDQHHDEILRDVASRAKPAGA
jgi:hypothetical protein